MLERGHRQTPQAYSLARSVSLHPLHMLERRKQGNLLASMHSLALQMRRLQRRVLIRQSQMGSRY